MFTIMKYVVVMFMIVSMMTKSSMATAIGALFQGEFLWFLSQDRDKPPKYIIVGGLVYSGGSSLIKCNF